MSKRSGPLSAPFSGGADPAFGRGVYRVPLGQLRCPAGTPPAWSAPPGGQREDHSVEISTLQLKQGSAGLRPVLNENPASAEAASTQIRRKSGRSSLSTRPWEINSPWLTEARKSSSAEPLLGVDAMAAFSREEEDRLSRGRAKRAGYAAPPLDSLSARARSPPRCRRLLAHRHPSWRPALALSQPKDTRR